MIRSSPMPVLWFRSDPLPDLIGDPSVVIGGTSLLHEFFGFTSEYRVAGALGIAASFVEDGIINARPRMWESMAHDQLEVRVVVQRLRDATAARQELGQYPWKSLQIGMVPKLHAKLYAFATAHAASAALIGSHNLTAPALVTNIEAGVLLRSRRPSHVGAVVGDVMRRIEQMLQESSVVMDSTSPEAVLVSERNTQ